MKYYKYYLIYTNIDLYTKYYLLSKYHILSYIKFFFIFLTPNTNLLKTRYIKKITISI